MRTISRFVIVRGFGNNFEEMVAFSKQIGFEYPMAHYYIEAGKNNEVFTLRGRPLSSRCAVMRDSFIMDSGVGIVVSSEDKNIDKTVSNSISKIIKTLIDELGIKNYKIVSDEINEDNRVDISMINPSIIPSDFVKIG